jgi:hypothetical protein
VVLLDKLDVGLGAHAARRTWGVVKQFRHSPPVVNGATLNSTYIGFVALPLVVVPVPASPLIGCWESPFCQGGAWRDP